MNDKHDRSTEKATEGAVPKAVIGRLSLYLRELQRLVHDGRETISSTKLGRLLGFSDAQVRKDLACFGQFGYPGIGYRCGELIDEIKRILGTNREWPIALVGVGNLGRALLRYKGFERQGFRPTAAFDVDRGKVGSLVEGVPTYHYDEMREVLRREEIRLAVIAVPATAAQAVADSLVEAGVEGILNFAPVTLTLPNHVARVGVDLAIELEQLSFAVGNRDVQP